MGFGTFVQSLLLSKKAAPSRQAALQQAAPATAKRPISRVYDLRRGFVNATVPVHPEELSITSVNGETYNISLIAGRVFVSKGVAERSLNVAGYSKWLQQGDNEFHDLSIVLNGSNVLISQAEIKPVAPPSLNVPVHQASSRQTMAFGSGEPVRRAALNGGQINLP
ncbi:MAG: hypothetical protein ABIH69_04255, partial [bacterium]